MLRQALVILALLQVGTEPSSIERAALEILKAGHTVGYLSQDKSTVAAFFPSSRVIFLNPDSDYWKDPAQTALNDYCIGRFSTSSVHHIPRHEIAHAEMYKAIGDARMADLAATLPQDVERIKSEVSEYAAVNCVEFYAEVSAGLAAKKKYSEAILGQYREMVK